MKTQMRKTHQWSKEDFMVTFFVTKYGYTGLCTKDSDELKNFIGTSKNSLTKMKSNFRHLLGEPNNLSHIKTLQQIVFDEYNNIDVSSFKDSVKKILKQDERELNKIFLSMGKNPSKMKKIGHRVN